MILGSVWVSTKFLEEPFLLPVATPPRGGLLAYREKIESILKKSETTLAIEQSTGQITTPDAPDVQTFSR